MSYVWLLWNIYIVCQNWVYTFSILCFLLLWFTVWLSRSGPFCLSPPVTFFLSCPIYICFLNSHSITVYVWYFIFLHTAHFFLSSTFPPHPLTLLLYLSEFTSPGHCEPGMYVWNPRESVCGHGETTRWHAGDDSLQRKRQIAWEAHKVSHYAGVYGFWNKSHSGLVVTCVVEAHKPKMAFWCCSVLVYASSAVMVNIYWTILHILKWSFVCFLFRINLVPWFWVCTWRWCACRFLQLWGICTSRTLFTVT